jgi:hypothetical protein
MIETTSRIICDGCGKELDPKLTESMAPLMLRDQSGVDLHFHDHRCVGVYANHKHEEHSRFVRGHLTKTVEELRHLVESPDSEHNPVPTEHHRATWHAQLAEAEDRLARFEKQVK